MANQPQLSRRKALKFLATAPLLPLGTSFASASLLSACGSGAYVAAAVPAPQYLATSFASSVLPTLANPAAMATTTVGSMLNVQFSDSSPPSPASRARPCSRWCRSSTPRATRPAPTSTACCRRRSRS